jgi:SAM-dependent methyltransferase
LGQDRVKAEHERHNEHRARWSGKPVLQVVYADLYRRIVERLAPGLVVEVGGGSGNLKEQLRDVLSFDVAWAPWLDFVADGQALPLADASVGNLVMLDVLHHIEFPRKFLAEAQRVLTEGGRVIMIEPGITSASWAFYRFVHEEPTIMDADPLRDGRPDPGKDPYSGNQAIPTLLFRRPGRIEQTFPDLHTREVQWLSLFAYPLSGGFKPWSLITPRLARAVLRAEDRIAPALGRWLGFRMLAVIEKRTAA